MATFPENKHGWHNYSFPSATITYYWFSFVLACTPRISDIYQDSTIFYYHNKENNGFRNLVNTYYKYIMVEIEDTGWKPNFNLNLYFMIFFICIHLSITVNHKMGYFQNSFLLPWEANSDSKTHDHSLKLKMLFA